MVDSYEALLDLLDGIERLLPEDPRERGNSGELLTEYRISVYSEARKTFINESRKIRENMDRFKRRPDSRSHASVICFIYDLNADFGPSVDSVVVAAKCIALMKLLYRKDAFSRRKQRVVSFCF